MQGTGRRERRAPARLAGPRQRHHLDALPEILQLAGVPIGRGPADLREPLQDRLRRDRLGLLDRPEVALCPVPVERVARLVPRAHSRSPGFDAEAMISALSATCTMRSCTCAQALLISASSFGVMRRPASVRLVTPARLAWAAAAPGMASMT